MKPREKLAALLREHGIQVEADELRANTGYWSHAQQDCYRWECFLSTAGEGFTFNGHVFIPGESIHLTSWDTMTECARRGIVLGNYERDLYFQIEVSAKPRRQP